MMRVTPMAVLIALLLFAVPAQSEQRFIAIAYHDVASEGSLRNNADTFSVSAQNLAAHFAWLQHHGYTPVSVSDLLVASRGEQPLPDKAVLLTFDDGLKSLYTQVYPLLKIFGYPAVASVVTDWLDMDPGQTVDNGRRQLARDAFISWDEAREMQASGLVEFASHSANLHRGIVANPQGNLMPAIAARAYQNGVYESSQDFRARIANDLERSVESISTALATNPRIMTWPFGKYNLSNQDVATKLDMPISMTLEVGNNSVAGLSSIGRILMRDNPGIADFSAMLLPAQRSPIVRAVQVDLDDIYDEDSRQQELNLDVLIESVRELQISHVLLQAYSDPDADGVADASYFPNRHLPVRADLFSRVSWQLKTRSDVRVFARMPILAFRGESFNPDWSVSEYAEVAEETLHPKARRVIREVYQDLAIYADFDGVLFQDEVDFSVRRSVATEQELINFSNELTGVLLENRPELKTARMLYAPAVLDGSSEAWLARSLGEFIEAYDYVVLMATAYLPDEKKSRRYLARLATVVSQTDDGLEQTIFDLQSVSRQNSSNILQEQMRSLQASGVKHLAYFPVDFIANRSMHEQIRKGMSLADYPFRGR